MATFDFNARRVNARGVTTISGRELLIKKAAQLEAERLKNEKEAAEAASKPKPAATNQKVDRGSGRKPIIPNALFAGGVVNLPVKGDKSAKPEEEVEGDAELPAKKMQAQDQPRDQAAMVPSALMHESVKANASVLVVPEKKSESKVEVAQSTNEQSQKQETVVPQETALRNPDVIYPPITGNPDVLLDALKGQEPANERSVEPGIPAPKRGGFSFKGAAEESDFEQMGMQAPPEMSESAIPAYVNQRDDGQFADIPHDDIPVFDESGQPILPQRGANKPQGMRLIAGIPATTFEEWGPNVPPGSHYDEWVWNAMDKPGHVTIELYVDARPFEKKAGTQSMLERVYLPTAAGAPQATPKFDPARHVLISIPQPQHAPWGSAKRVLLTPQTIKALPNRQDKRGGGMDFAKKNTNSGTPKAEVKEKPIWEADPAGITAWLNRKPHHNVIFGRVLLDASARGGQMYWMVLSKEDATRIHREIYGDNPKENLDPQHRFGLEGLFHVKREKNYRGWWEDVRTPDDEVRAVPPAKRYLGHWSGEDALRALRLAGEGAGPQMPADWPQEDVQVVAQSHAALLERANSKEQAKEHALLTPRSKPAVDLPPVQAKKKDAPVNRMRMRAF